MYYDAEVYWNKGSVSSCNQDSLVLLQVLTSQGSVLMAAVCDGMGGMDAGEIASGYLTEELVTWFYDGLLDAVGKKKPLWIIRRSVERKVYQVQSRMQRYAEKQSLQMGTTLSMLILWEKRYLLCHLGDSRIYKFWGKRKGKMLQISNDHVQGGCQLTKCVGSFGFFTPDFKIGTVKSGEAFLLCSDGFWHKMQPEELREALMPARMQRKQWGRRLREIGETAIRRGEKDNLSAIYVQVGKGWGGGGYHKSFNRKV